jgi:hypothetical protein
MARALSFTAEGDMPSRQFTVLSAVLFELAVRDHFQRLI